MKHAISVVAAVATMSIGSAAIAAEHEILILSDGYFPQITYLSSGDSVLFINESATDQSIISKNDSWTLGPIPPNGTETLVFTKGDQNTFYNADLVDEEGVYLVEGTMSLGTAPLN